MAGSLYGAWLYGGGYYSALHAVDIAGNLAVAPAAAGSLSQVFGLSGALQPSLTLWSGSLTAAIGLSGALPIRTALYGTLSNPVDLGGGALIAKVALAGGAFPLTLALSGQLVPVVTPYGDVTYTAKLSGNLTVGVNLANPPITAGPLWVADPLCPDPPGTPSELCDG